MSSQSNSYLHSRIASWTQEVASAHEHPQHPQHKRARSSTKTAAQAQSSARAPLEPVTANAGKRKRPTTAQSKPSEPRKRRRPSPLPTSTKLKKRKQDNRSEGKKELSTHKRSPVARRRRNMVDEGAEDVSGVRRSGRDRKPTQKAQSTDKTQQECGRFTSLHPLQDHLHGPTSLQNVPQLLPSSSAAMSNADEVERPLPSPSRSSGSPTKRTGSPKKSDRYLGKAKSDASLKKSDLAHMVPSVDFMEVGDVLDLVRPLPGSVAALREGLFDQPGYIPLCLKSHYDQEFSTPTRSKGGLPSYQSTFANEAEDATGLQKEVEYVRKTASWNFAESAHERQWGTATISPILNTLARIHADRVRLLNLESCLIQPVELRPERQGGGRIDVEVESVPSNDTTSTSPPLTTSRMVDYGFGLRISPPSRSLINDAFSQLEDSKRSLNQSLSYHDRVPLLADIEIKKSNADREPEVQLGVWQAAGYKKRKLHGWSTSSMPMPGICINGHDWYAYITFERMKDHLIAMGPISIGNTRSIPGIWQILYKLDKLLQWAETECQGWFEKEIMGWAKALAPSR